MVLKLQNSSFWFTSEEREWVDELVVARATTRSLWLKSRLNGIL